MQGSSEDIVNLFMVSSLIILIVIAGVAIFMVVYQRRLVRQRLQLQAQEIAYQEKMLHVSVDTQEKERQRIGKDLHDEVGAMLSAVKMNLNLIDRKLKKLTEQPADLGEAKSMLDDAIANVRNISHDLLPPGLVKFGLASALEGFREKISRLSGINYEMHTQGEEIRLPTRTELAVYRVVQELTHNSLKHGEAQNIRLDCIFSPESVTVTYQEDGKGFDAAGKSGGMGLLNMQNRIRLALGEFQLESSPGNGVKATIQIPTSAQN